MPEKVRAERTQASGSGAVRNRTLNPEPHTLCCHSRSENSEIEASSAITERMAAKKFRAGASGRS